MRSKSYYVVRGIARFAFLLLEAALVLAVIYGVMVGCGAWYALING